jgi:DNA polymerase III delta prime subunit
MSRINVLVAYTSHDVVADGIAASVAGRADMSLVSPTQEGSRQHLSLTVAEAEALLESLPPSPQCAVVLVGRPIEADDLAQRWIAKRADLVVMHVEVGRDVVRIALRDPGLDALLTALHGLVESVGAQGRERIAHIQLRPAGATEGATVVPDQVASTRPLLQASIEWVHQLLRDAVERVPDENGDVSGLCVTRKTLLQALDSPAERDPKERPTDLTEAETALDRARAAADPASEPLAAAADVFDLDPLEFRLMVLALSPELDLRFQRCIGFLLDEMSRRVGTIGFYAALLGATAGVRGSLAARGALADWLVFEGAPGRPPAADEPLRLDPALVQWLLGERDAFSADPRVRRTLRLEPWRGRDLVQRREERVNAISLIDRLREPGGRTWVLLDGDDPAGWRALIEVGAACRRVQPTRVEVVRLAGVDMLEVEECARRIGRLTRLTNDPLIIDLTATEEADGDIDWLRVFFAALKRTCCQAAIICRDESRSIKLLGAAAYDLVDEPALPLAARVAAVRAAAHAADLYLSDTDAEALVHQFPLHVDGFEHAMRLAGARPLRYTTDDPRLTRFTEACREVAGEGISHLADRLDPIFTLDDVVLPADRKQQLIEVVDNVRLAPRVLDGWKFGDQLPYGRGVSALFFGPSGTGKTMAALGIARRLGVQILRLDLSRVESKYIGDTPKNLDRVFTDGEKSGATILIDEADALFGRRSEVKDAHDRYANIEVAYLLQRMESYEGLAILTTNARQGLDPAFLRRLRFIIEFPRPDVEAREKIWRRCLPAESHTLDDAAFRQLARRIDLTGGHIRQITLRAAFIAAAADTRITLEHIAQASRAELAKLGMPPVELDLKAREKAA